MDGGIFYPGLCALDGFMIIFILSAPTTSFAFNAALPKAMHKEFHASPNPNLYVEYKPISGLSLFQMGMIPKTNYRSLKDDQSYTCGICLDLIEYEDEILLRSCQHYYHISCIG